MKAYGGSILNVNLTTGRIFKEDLSENLCRSFIGGKGLGTKILYDCLDAKVDALSAGNIVVLTNGPASGTIIPLASRVNFSFKSPLTGICAESQMGGYLSPKLKWAKIDAIIISGRSRKPLYLEIWGSSADLKDASHLWGKSTFETEKIIKEDVGREAAVAEIGPAGENCVRFACVCHAEGGRQAGRAGIGAVLGSKNLKALAVVSDRSDVEVSNEDGLRGLVAEVAGHIKRDPIGTLAENYRKYGTAIVVDIANQLQFFPTKYWSKVSFEKYRKIGAKALSRIVVRNRACFNCPFACGKYVEVREGEFSGTKVEGPEYETIYAFGGLCEIDNIAAIAKLNELCDKYGLDTITTGNAAAFAIEAYQRGKLKTKRRLRYSAPEDIIWLIEQIAQRKGIGKILSEGVKKASSKLGLEDIAIESKGLEPPGYDPRSLTGMALAYSLSDRGACHLRAVMYASDISGETDRFSIRHEKVLTYLDNEDRFNIFDCMILCRFSRKVYDWPRLANMVKCLTGFEYEKEDLMKISQRIQTLARLLNLKCCPSLEDTIATRFFKEPVRIDGKKTAVNEYDLKRAVKDYYDIRGWDEKGMPKRSTKRDLQIE